MIARIRGASSRPEKSSTSWASRESTWTSWKRVGYAFFRSASSSSNMIEPVRRLPKTSVTVSSGLSCSAVVMSDMIGVMPDPAAKATW